MDEGCHGYTQSKVTNKEQTLKEMFQTKLTKEEFSLQIQSHMSSLKFSLWLLVSSPWSGPSVFGICKHYSLSTYNSQWNWIDSHEFPGYCSLTEKHLGKIAASNKGKSKPPQQTIWHDLNDSVLYIPDQKIFLRIIIKFIPFKICCHLLNEEGKI